MITKREKKTKRKLFISSVIFLSIKACSLISFLHTFIVLHLNQSTSPSVLKITSFAAMDSDRLSSLPEEVLVSILSFLPQKTKTQTSCLARRFRNLWKHTDELSVYGDHSNHVPITEYINNNLTSYVAPVLRIFNLRLQFGDYRSANITECLNFVVSRHVQHLVIDCDAMDFYVPIPISIFYCNSVRELKICGSSIYMLVPAAASLPSLKILEVKDLKFMSPNTLQRLLNAAPGLQSLYLGLQSIEYEIAYTVHSDSLKNLSIQTGEEIKSIDVRTPSLKTLRIFDRSLHAEGDIDDDQHVDVQFQKMSNLEEAYVDVGEIDIASLLKAIISVKKLTICSTMDLHLNDLGVLFDRLKDLKICHCAQCRIGLHDLLTASPNVSVLHIFIDDEHTPSDFNIIQFPPQLHVPDSTMGKLEKLIWTEFSGESPESDYIFYIIRKARALRTVDISFREDVRFTKMWKKDFVRVERESAAVQINIQVSEEESSESDSEGD